MPQADWALVIVGGVFIFLGILAIFWGRHEETSYYSTFTGRNDLRVDMREYLYRWPPRIEPGAIKLGGWVAIIVGIALIGFGIYLFNQ